MTPYHHAMSSSKKFGGKPEHYYAIHDWFDETKSLTGDFSHRALRHHSYGIQQAIEKFGATIKVKTDKRTLKIPTKLIAEQHVLEDCGFIPTVEWWLKPLKNHPEPWMLKVKTKTTTKLKISS